MGYSQIAKHERYIIKHYLAEGYSIRKIGRALSKDHSSISREIKRNSGLKGYRPKQAHEIAENRKQAKIKCWKFTEEIKRQIRIFLKKYWSPEQIAGWFKSKDKIMMSVSMIYNYISDDKTKGGSLWKYLRHSRKKYRKKYGSGASATLIPSRVSIDDRPEVVEKKERIGDWEIDTIIGKKHKGVLVTIVERVSKYTVIGKCRSKDSSIVANKVVELLRPVKDLVKTITSDNGKEFSSHELFSKKLNADVYFAHPYSSWERGLNENTNGLIRQFFPKGSSFKGIKEKSILNVQELLNLRPRKDLGFCTPKEVFFGK